MRRIRIALVAALCFFSISLAQNPPAARTDVYHVHFAKASLGKGAEEGDFLKRQGPNSPMPGHYLVLRHQSGEDWDYVAIEHLGTRATVNAAAPPPPAGARDLNAWHTDSFVSGPAWPDFARAMGLDDAAKSAASVYVVSVFRAAPEHRDQLVSTRKVYVCLILPLLTQGAVMSSLTTKNLSPRLPFQKP